MLQVINQHIDHIDLARLKRYIVTIHDMIDHDRFANYSIMLYVFRLCQMYSNNVHSIVNFLVRA